MVNKETVKRLLAVVRDATKTTAARKAAVEELQRIKAYQDAERKRRAEEQKSQGIKVDFAGDPMARSLADLREEQKRRDPFWDQQARWQEDIARAQAGNRTPPVRVIMSEDEWPTTF